MKIIRVATAIEKGSICQFTAGDIASQAGLDPSTFSFNKINYIDPLTNAQVTSGPLCVLENDSLTVNLTDLPDWAGSVLVTIYCADSSERIAIVLQINSN